MIRLSARFSCEEKQHSTQNTKETLPVSIQHKVWGWNRIE